ncbi:MAG: 2-C-methyl-D-erythritol 4-phosphate cytidylyltransferase [Pseudohongiellaceae bacterium]
MALWAIVPAAGSSRRMRDSAPKQYLRIDGQPVLLHTLSRLSALPGLDGVVLVLSPDDIQWPAIAAARPEAADAVTICRGGAERRHSVINGLLSLAGRAAEDDWVLIHDAARPCVRVADMQRLLQAVEYHPVGGLLAVPVADTLKRGNAANAVLETVDRSGLWAAQTPQLFRYGPLRDALSAGTGDKPVTDEASAMENAGHEPLLVVGSPDNIKITWPPDLHLAGLILQAQRCET